MPNPDTTEPRRVVLLKIYARERTTRTGREYPVGKHLRAELRDAETNELLAKHAYSPFSTMRLEADALRHNQKIVRRRWTTESEVTNARAK